MKILKHGNLSKRLFVCDECGCEFVASRGEYDKFFGENGFVFFCYCPECFCYCPECKGLVSDSGLYDDVE